MRGDNEPNSSDGSPVARRQSGFFKSGMLDRRPSIGHSRNRDESDASLAPASNKASENKTSVQEAIQDESLRAAENEADPSEETADGQVERQVETQKQVRPKETKVVVNMDDIESMDARLLEDDIVSFEAQLGFEVKTGMHAVLENLVDVSGVSTSLTRLRKNMRKVEMELTDLRESAQAAASENNERFVLNEVYVSNMERQEEELRDLRTVGLGELSAKVADVEKQGQKLQLSAGTLEPRMAAQEQAISSACSDVKGLRKEFIEKSQVAACSTDRLQEEQQQTREYMETNFEMVLTRLQALEHRAVVLEGQVKTHEQFLDKPATKLENGEMLSGQIDRHCFKLLKPYVPWMSMPEQQQEFLKAVENTYVKKVDNDISKLKLDFEQHRALVMHDSQQQADRLKNVDKKSQASLETQLARIVELSEELKVHVKLGDLVSIQKHTSIEFKDLRETMSKDRKQTVAKLGEVSEALKSQKQFIEDLEHTLQHQAEELEGRATKWDVAVIRRSQEECATWEHVQNTVEPLRESVDLHSQKLEESGLLKTSTSEASEVPTHDPIGLVQDQVRSISEGLLGLSMLALKPPCLKTSRLLTKDQEMKIIEHLRSIFHWVKDRQVPNGWDPMDLTTVALEASRFSTSALRGGPRASVVAPGRDSPCEEAAKQLPSRMSMAATARASTLVARHSLKGAAAAAAAEREAEDSESPMEASTASGQLSRQLSLDAGPPSVARAGGRALKTTPRRRTEHTAPATDAEPSGWGCRRATAPPPVQDDLLVDSRQVPRPESRGGSRAPSSRHPSLEYTGSVDDSRLPPLNLLESTIAEEPLLQSSCESDGNEGDWRHSFSPSVDSRAPTVTPTLGASRKIINPDSRATTATPGIGRRSARASPSLVTAGSGCTGEDAYEVRS